MKNVGTTPQSMKKERPLGYPKIGYDYKLRKKKRDNSKVSSLTDLGKEDSRYSFQPLLRRSASSLLLALFLPDNYRIKVTE